MDKAILPRWIIRLGYAWSILFLPLVWIDTRDDPIGNAIIGMGIGLLILWMIVGALVQLKLKDKLTTFDSNIIRNFTITATIMALIEEAITTTMTNLAQPVWGVSSEDAFITASTNYLEVVLLHSVIVFIPMYLCWGYLLRKYQFHHLWVYVLFGITGTLAETLSFGPANLINIGFWLNIYGLTVYLPAYLVRKKERIQPSWYLYPVAIILPLLAAIPVVILVLLVQVTFTV